MSYGSHPIYIWSDGTVMHFWGDIAAPGPDEAQLPGVNVTDRALNALLYKLLLSDHRTELATRLRDGRAVWAKEWDNETRAHFATVEDETYRRLAGGDGASFSAPEVRRCPRRPHWSAERLERMTRSWWAVGIAACALSFSWNLTALAVILSGHHVATTYGYIGFGGASFALAWCIVAYAVTSRAGRLERDGAP